jgi:hypothetical protein
MITKNPAAILAALLAIAGSALAQAPAGGAQKVEKAQCERYATQAANQNKSSIHFGCGLKGGLWNSNPQYHLKWCMEGHPASELQAQEKDRSMALENCEKRKGTGAKKGPTQQACQGVMNSYSADMKNWNAAQTQCQNLANAKKPTMAVYNRYLKYCNDQDTAGRRFYSMGCDKAFPNMAAPGQGPNTCAQQVHDNCPQVK